MNENGVRTLRLGLEYDGAGFSGWAAQPDRRTVEGVALETFRRLFPRLERIAVAGRTDAGVHATGQVISFAASGGPPDDRVLRAANAVLPVDLAVRSCERAPDGFDARFSARSRTYEYRLLRSFSPAPLRAGRTLQWPWPLDPALLDACARAITGEHDFRAFTPTETQHRTFRRAVLGARCETRGDELVFVIEADSFLRHMVRTLVGTILEIAGGQRPLASLTELLAGCDRADAGITAPPQALCLTGVRYALEARAA